MANKKPRKKQVNKVQVDEELVKKVDSLVDEIERTNHFKKIVESDYSTTDNIEQLEETAENKFNDLNVDSKSNDDKNDDNEKTEQLETTQIDINKTNLYNFTFDDDRLSEVDSLDTSFLEGRINNQKEKKTSNRTSKKSPKKVANESSNVKKPVQKPVVKKPSQTKEIPKKVEITPKASVSKNINKNYFLLICTTIVIVVGFFAFSTSVNKKEQTKKPSVEEKKQVDKTAVDEDTPIIDDNYLFVGDQFILGNNQSGLYAELPVAFSGSEKITSKELLDDIKKYIYDFNPSKVLIHVGTYDIIEDDYEYTKDNIRDIIKGIQEVRPYAKIYVESLYPVNNGKNKKQNASELRDIDNEKIKELNKEIKNTCQENKVQYVDLYNDLYNEDDEGLTKEYTDNGFSINGEGYKKITSLLKKEFIK